MKKKFALSIVLVLVTILACGISTTAANKQNTYGLKSQGRILFTNDTDDTSDDVVFDATDLYNIAAKCQ